MGDWTSGTVTIHTCPPRRARTVLDVLTHYGMTDEDSTNDRATVQVGESYHADEFRCGDAVELADGLIQRAPDVAFTVYEEPAYDWLGTRCTYVPDLGLFTTDCDNSGEAMFAQSHILKLDDEPGDVRQRQLGVPWLTAISAMPAETVVEPHRFATHWDRRHREITIVGGQHDGADLTFSASADETAVDATLAEREFQRVGGWEQLDETTQVWRTDVYRSPHSELPER